MLFLLWWGVFEFLFDIYSNLPNQDSIFATIIGNLMVLTLLDAYSLFLIADDVPCGWTEFINPFSIEKNSLQNPIYTNLDITDF